MFIRNFDSFTVCGRAEWSEQAAAGFPLDTRASLHTEERGGRRAAVAERAEGWTLRMTTFL